ncbi:hypothetical protein QJS10_CPA03g01815 [Acorus calamus]|uniref:UVR domain-containing protein n=1 Tax=Acorus calamus TaxID=4465 RepID=A0AAV9F6M2_ACOCL|nr:hypothetical protein QJS10_CPA03g01815 [Acorus calamus]
MAGPTPSVLPSRASVVYSIFSKPNVKFSGRESLDHMRCFCVKNVKPNPWFRPISTPICKKSPRLQNLNHLKSGESEQSITSEDLIVDEQALQSDLERAIKEENYAKAAKLRDNLRTIHEDSKASVLAANLRFYKAFGSGDLVAMNSIWAKGDNIYCVHPGAGAISGHELVLESWELVLGAEHEFPIQIDLKNVEVHIRGDVGYVTCLEVVKTKVELGESKLQPMCLKGLTGDGLFVSPCITY